MPPGWPSCALAPSPTSKCEAGRGREEARARTFHILAFPFHTSPPTGTVASMSRRLRPFVEREATWAVVLAALGFVSMCATLPAAGVLGFRAMRRPRGGDGSEPALGMLAFGVGWLSFLLAYPAMRMIVLAAVQPGHWVARAFLGSVVVLAVAIVVLSCLAVRMHPERWVARRIVMIGIGVAVAATFAQAMTLVLGGLPARSFLS